MYVLIVDDEEKSRGILTNFLQALGHHVTECSDGRAALELFSAQEFNMVLTDIRMPSMSGIELLQKIRSLPFNRDVAVILFTGYSDQETAIAALRSGAYDYLIKPIKLQELVAATERVAKHLAINIGHKGLTGESDAVVQATTEKAPEELTSPAATNGKSMGLGSETLFSDRMMPIIERTRIFHNDRSLPVLIEGETGTGKEVIARLIHFANNCACGPFVDLNCAALAPSVFETELFGYEAGAFTGGLPRGQIGKLDLAAGGTLFLDEITEMPLELQSKLLRVIQEKEFYRVGGLKKIKTDMRIICSTNTAMEEKVEQGAFRRDLFYRLNVGHICLPLLRERRDEIIPLAELFLTRYSKEKRKDFRRIGGEAAKVLLSYAWPGNIRELKNVIELAVALYNDLQLKPDHLDLSLMHKSIIRVPGTTTLLSQNGLPLKKYTDALIVEALKTHDGNKTHAANYLGISLRTLQRRLNNLTKREKTV